MTVTSIHKLTEMALKDPQKVMEVAPDYIINQFYHLTESNGGMGLRGKHATNVLNSMNTAMGIYGLVARKKRDRPTDTLVVNFDGK